jgi:small-conductance mechanosensitive channel
MKPAFQKTLALSLAVAAPTGALGLDENGAAAVEQFARVIRWGGVVTSLFVMAGAWLLLRLLRDSLERLGAQFSAQRLTFQKVGTIVQFVVYVSAAAIVLVLSLRLDDKVLALIGGTAAVSIGFALKDLVASFVAGIMIMVDRPFQVGDRVAFAGEYGDIVAVGLRSVRMRTLDDNTVTIPNNKFLSDVTSSGNYGQLDMQVVTRFFIGLDQDVDSALDVIHEAALTSRYVHLPKPVVVLAKQIVKDNLIALELVLKAYVLDTKYEKAFESDLTLRVLRAFRQRGITPPAVLHRAIAGASPAPTLDPGGRRPAPRSFEEPAGDDPAGR